MAKTKILVVEDEIIIADDIKRRLQRLGYDVPCVLSSGEEAIKKAEEEHPSLILMDIVLKGEMSGIEAAKHIHSRFNIPVIYLTAYADDKTLERAKITDPFGYIIKPFEERELRTTIEMALYKHCADRKLRESEERYRTLIDNASDAILTADTEGNLISANKKAGELLGYTKDELLHMHFPQIHPQGEIERTAAVFQEAFRKGENSMIGVVLRKDGKTVPVEITASIIEYAGKRVNQAIFRDITERKRMEEDILKMQKLESISLLAGGIAHDFNNILTGILGNISLALLDIHSEENIVKRLTEAEISCTKARNLIQQLLTFARGGTPVKKTAFIRELIKDSTDLALKGTAVRCEFLLPNGLRSVEIDEAQIRQVIHNIVTNAAEAMPQGGTIRVCCENITLAKDHGVPLPEGDYVKITIQDSGVGMPREHLQKIFDPYFTTKNKRSGLGLATSYSIINNHNGYIAAESELGRGTTIYIYLPASLKQINKKKEYAETGTTPGRGSILIMDDEDVVRNVAGEMLKHMGYKVALAEDGAEAVRLYTKAKDMGDPFDAVIMDLTVPGGMGGKEAVKKLLEIDPGVKAIVSSGYSGDPIMANYKEYGFSGVVPKPYKIKELIGALQSALSGEDSD